MRTKDEIFDALCTLFESLINAGCVLPQEIELYDKLSAEWMIQCEKGEK